jgi:CBS domain-containing protein
MDGGRVLRALLATQLDHAQATQIAARIGQGIAVLFGIAGLFFNPFLILIAVFVYMGAQQEAMMAQMKAATAGIRVRDAMISRFQTLPEEMPLASAVEEVLRDTQPIYPVTDPDLRVLGMALRNDILAAAGAAGPPRTIASVARVTPSVRADASFEEAFDLMQQSGSPVLPVVNPSGQIIGLVSLNLLSERTRLRRA